MGGATKVLRLESVLNEYKNSARNRSRSVHIDQTAAT